MMASQIAISEDAIRQWRLNWVSGVWPGSVSHGSSAPSGRAVIRGDGRI